MQLEIENSVAEESPTAESKTESVHDKTQSPSDAESNNKSSSSNGDDAGTEQLTPESKNQESPVFSEQALEEFLSYLEKSLTDDQHGGQYRISEYNGSGLYMHGGPDKADPYIVIWVIDKDAVNHVVESYDGQKVDIVSIDAAYSVNRLNSIMSELQNSEIAPYIKQSGAQC